MKKWIGLVLTLGLLASLSATPASAVDFNFSGSLTASDPDQTGRLNRDGIPSTCANEGGPASLFTTSGARNYDAFTFTNGSTAACVTVTLNAMSCTGATFLYIAAYSSFNPANPALNVIAQAGDSPNPTISFSFDLAANQSVTIVVHEVTPGALCAAYSGTISGLSAGATTPVTFRSVAAARTSKGVTIRWHTASELDMLGFNVYREVKGKRVRANSKLIAGKGRGLYSFLDRKAPKAKSVRYWIQVVNLDTSRSWYGPARIART